MRKIIENSNSGASRIKRIKQTFFFAREKFDSIEIGLPANSVWGGDGTYNNIYGYNFDLNYELEFDSNSLIVEKKVYNKHPEIEPDDFKIITYKYNDCGQIMEMYDVCNSKRIFNYNNDDLLIETKDFDSNGYLETKTSCQYDDTNRIDEVHVFNHKGEVEYSKIYSYYDDAYYYLKISYPEALKHNNEHFIYDNKNNLLVKKAIENIWIGHNIIEYLKTNNHTNYRYDKDGNVISISIGAGNYYSVFYDGFIKYEYDAMGNWVKAIHYRNSVAYLVKLREITYF